MNTRRTFLTRLALGGAAAFAVRGQAEVRPVVGSQLYGWGQYYARDGKRLEDHLDEVFAALRDAGFDYAEGNLDVADPEGNGRFAERLRNRGMRPVSLYTGGSLHLADQADKAVGRIVAAARVAAGAGFEVIVCNPDPIGRAKTDAELLVQARALSDLGDALSGLGLRLGLHHHTPELADGAREFHSNFERTRAGRVDFCIDTHWMYRGGVPPMDALSRYGDRVVSWHLRQSRGKVWWEDLDTGDIDYPAIARLARERGMPPRYTVELALEAGTRITRTVVENHARSRGFVRQIFGA